MNYYSPFNKPIQQVEGKDLVTLKTAYEGWYLDYKSDSIEISNFAKSMSAFANHEGGWLFVGVKEEEVPNPEKGKKHNTKLRNAASFPGVDTSRCESVIQDLRTAASNAYLSPRIVFEAFTVHGPVPEIELEAGKSVILVHVPSSPNPPHVHKDGCVYRRHLDSCDPVPVTARGELDEMWRRATRNAAQLETFLFQPVSEAPGHLRDAPVVHIYLFVSEMLEAGDVGLTYARFVEVLKGISNAHSPSTLTHFGSTHDGYVARVRYTSDGSKSEILSLRWWNNGSIRLTVPIRQISFTKVWRRESGDSFGVFQRLLKDAPFHVAGENGYHGPDVLDLGSWVLTVVAMFGYYLGLHQSVQLTPELTCKVIVKGVRGYVPFLPVAVFLDQCRTSGIPVVEDPLFMLPPGLGRDSFLPLSVSGTLAADVQVKSISAIVAGVVLQGLGLDVSWASSIASAGEIPAEFSQVISNTNDAIYRNELRGV